MTRNINFVLLDYYMKLVFLGDTTQKESALADFIIYDYLGVAQGLEVIDMVVGLCSFQLDLSDEII